MSQRVVSAVAVALLVASAAPAAEKELHVVAAHVGHDAPKDRGKPGTAAVTVDRPGKDVVLVVSAYNPTAWEVRATPKTNLTKVLALGYHRQTVIAPPGVAVEELTHDAKQEGLCRTYIYGYYDTDAPRFRPFVQKLGEHTQLEIASFQGVYQFDPKKPFVVDAVQKDERFSREFPKVAPAAQIPKLKFEATRLVFVERGGTKTGYGEFTQTGPTADGFVALPSNIRQVACDTKAKQHYGIDRHNLFTLDVKLGTSAKIAPPGGNFGWTQSLTVDTKRDRVLISTRGGLYEYAPKGEGKWTQLTKDRSVSFAALVWQPKTDTLFAFGAERDRKRSEILVPTLYELKVDGTVANKTALGSPLFPGILGEHGIDDNAELIDLGAELALLVHRENRDSGTGERGKPESFLYVIDPKTGKVQLAWKE